MLILQFALRIDQEDNSDFAGTPVLQMLCNRPVLVGNISNLN